MEDITSVIKDIQQGNEHMREELIASSREKIRRYASFICKRQLEWQNDDELSISLVAFNRGIDNYDALKGKGFYLYARLIIKNSLIDYFKSQGKNGNPFTVPLDEESTSAVSWEAAAARQKFEEELDRQEKAYEIDLFKKVLGDFSLTLQELAKYSPRHRDTRKILKEAARKVGNEERLVTRIYREKKLPLKEIQLLTGIKRKTLERWRRYLLSLIIIWSHAELAEISEYLWGKETSFRK